MLRCANVQKEKSKLKGKTYTASPSFKSSFRRLMKWKDRDGLPFLTQFFAKWGQSVDDVREDWKKTKDGKEVMSQPWKEWYQKELFCLSVNRPIGAVPARCGAEFTSEYWLTYVLGLGTFRTMCYSLWNVLYLAPVDRLIHWFPDWLSSPFHQINKSNDRKEQLFSRNACMKTHWFWCRNSDQCVFLAFFWEYFSVSWQ